LRPSAAAMVRCRPNPLSSVLLASRPRICGRGGTSSARAWVVAVVVATAAVAGGASHAESDIGKCICDLGAGSCDVHCCCDPDCQGLGDLRGSFECQDEGPTNRSDHRCYSKTWVRNINPRVDFWVVADELSELLCVEVDNSPVEGVFFTNDARIPAERIGEEIARQRLTSWNSSRAPSLEPIAMIARSYLVGDLLKVHVGLDQQNGRLIDVRGVSDLQGSGVAELVTDLHLPTADTLGACDAGRGQAARFLVDMPKSSCWEGPADLKEACGAALNPRLLGRWLMRRVRLPEDMRCNEERCLAPNVTTFCPTPSQAAAWGIDLAACTSHGSAAVEDSQLVPNSSPCTCKGAILAAEYVLRYGFDARYDGAAISGVEVRVALQDLRSEDCKSMPQFTSLRFVQDAGPEVVASERSGNPGYQVGLPLLAARCVEYDEVKSQCARFESLEQSGHAVAQGILQDGRCANFSEAGRNASMNFGEDALFACTLYLTRAELASLCSSAAGEGGFMERLKLLSLPFTYLAAFGGVNPTSQNPEDWVQISMGDDKEVLSFTDGDAGSVGASASVCRGAALGVALEVMYSPFGEIGNPQLKIVAARASHSFGALSFMRPDPSRPQTFQFSTTLSYVRLDDTTDRETAVPPHPPLPRLLPHDLFYPFRLGSSGTSARRGRFDVAVVVLLLAPLLARQLHS